MEWKVPLFKIYTDDGEVYQRLKLLRSHGRVDDKDHFEGRK